MNPALTSPMTTMNSPMPAGSRTRPAPRCRCSSASAGELAGWPSLVFVIGLFLTLILVMRRVTSGIVIGILATTALAIVVEALVNAGPAFVNGTPVPTGWRLNVPALPADWFSLPDFSLIGEVDLFGAFTRIGVLAAVLIVFVAAAHRFLSTRWAPSSASATKPDSSTRTARYTASAGSCSSTPPPPLQAGSSRVRRTRPNVESAAGIGEGARTGLANIVTGAAFLLAMFLAPLVAIIPFEAASPALVVVGLAMMSQIRRITFTATAAVVEEKSPISGGGGVVHGV